LEEILSSETIKTLQNKTLYDFKEIWSLKVGRCFTIRQNKPQGTYSPLILGLNMSSDHRVYIHQPGTIQIMKYYIYFLIIMKKLDHTYRTLLFSSNK